MSIKLSYREELNFTAFSLADGVEITSLSVKTWGEGIKQVKAGKGFTNTTAAPPHSPPITPHLIHSPDTIRSAGCHIFSRSPSESWIQPVWPAAVTRASIWNHAAATLERNRVHGAWQLPAVRGGHHQQMKNELSGYSSNSDQSCSKVTMILCY